eukprot:234737-Pleurochrysis_carterae.AAC.3
MDRAAYADDRLGMCRGVPDVSVLSDRHLWRYRRLGFRPEHHRSLLVRCLAAIACIPRPSLNNPPRVSTWPIPCNETGRTSTLRLRRARSSVRGYAQVSRTPSRTTQTICGCRFCVPLSRQARYNGEIGKMLAVAVDDSHCSCCGMSSVRVRRFERKSDIRSEGDR